MAKLYVEQSVLDDVYKEADARPSTDVLLPGSLYRARADMSVAVLDYVLGIEGITMDIQHAYLEV